MKTQPKPLDLEEIGNKWIEIKSLDGKPKISMKKRFYCFDIFKEIKQRLKSACEFYLRYKDNPELLVEEHPEYEDELYEITAESEELIKEFGLDESGEFIKSYGATPVPVEKELKLDDDEYNEWLFKLAFKDVFETKFDKGKNVNNNMDR